MDKKEIQDATRAYFKSIGFQVLKKTRFFYDNDQLTLQVMMDYSHFSALYTFYYYFRIKALHPEIKSMLNDEVWDTFGGSLVYNNKKGFGVEYALWTKEKFLEELDLLVKKDVIPIIREGIPYIKKLAKNPRSLDPYVVFSDKMRDRILALELTEDQSVSYTDSHYSTDCNQEEFFQSTTVSGVVNKKKLNFFQRLRVKKYQPIIDYVEGRMSVTEFQKMFNEDRSLRKTLNQPMDKKYGFLKNYDFILADMLDKDPIYADRNWNTITLRRRVQAVLVAFLENFGVKSTLYTIYKEEFILLLSIQPSWLRVQDDTLDSIVYEIPKDLSKTKQIAWGKQRVKELFRYDKSYPRWIQGAEWPIVNGKPLVFSHQERIKGDDYHVLYYFYDPDTKEQTVVEQFS